MLTIEQTQQPSVAQRWTARAGRVVTITWTAAVAAMLAWGWVNRDEGFLSPESGLGYGLGIFGCTMMVTLLSYSLRKRWQKLRKIFSIRRWFQFHMILGILGPLCIIFHSNFHLGSVNSTVALVCMLLVAGSGVIGRYIYQKIHFGLYGEKIKLQQVLGDFEYVKGQMLALPLKERQRHQSEKMFSAINDLVHRQSTTQSVFAYFGNRQRAKKIALAIKKFISVLERQAIANGLQLSETDRLYRTLHESDAVLQQILRKMPGLHLFEKLFSLWHVVHIPIFILMLGSAVTHVVVVHMY